MIACRSLTVGMARFSTDPPTYSCCAQWVQVPGLSRALSWRGIWIKAVCRLLSNSVIPQKELLCSSLQYEDESQDREDPRKSFKSKLVDGKGCGKLRLQRHPALLFKESLRRIFTSIIRTRNGNTRRHDRRCL